MEPWAERLVAGDSEAAWDLFVRQYRRLVFAAIRHYTTDHDEGMDIFARLCAALRKDDFARLRTYLAQPEHRARFSTWLVTVVHNQTVDWFRHRDGRPRLGTFAVALPPLRQRIFELVFMERRPHAEVWERLRVSEGRQLTPHEFASELRETYRAVSASRSRWMLAGLVQPWPGSGPDPPGEDPAERGERASLIARALECLPAEDRLAVQLYVIDEMPAEQVAKAAGFPNAKTVYNRVYRALAEIRAHLEGVGIRKGDL